MRKYKTFYLALALAAFLLLPTSARACEMPWTAAQELSELAQDDADRMNELIEELTNYIDAKVGDTATTEMQSRLSQLDDNLRDFLYDWWSRPNGFLESMRMMTAQLHFSKIDQTRHIGSLIDAQQLNEHILTVQTKQVDAMRRYKPSELTCQMDSINSGGASGQGGPGQAAVFAKALNVALAKDTLAGTALDLGGGVTAPQPSRVNRVGSASANGAGAEQAVLWNEYVTYWCDPSKGDQGCNGHTPANLGAAGQMPGRQVDIPSLLWGEKQTIDMSDEREQLVVQAAQRTLITPFSADPIPGPVMNASAGQEKWLLRRAREARVNTIYNVFGAMVTERAGQNRNATAPGTVDAEDVLQMRTAAGVNVADISGDPSYREIQQVLMKERFYDPQYMTKLVDDPAAVIREQGAINAARLQQSNDFYRRQEELLFMQAAIFAHDLDKQVPDNAVEATPKR